LAVVGSSVARFRSLRGSACHSAAVASLFALLVGAAMDLGVDEVEEVGEVAGGPAGDGLCKSLRNHVRRFTF
jgi:hypothetical protein